MTVPARRKRTRAIDTRDRQAYSAEWRDAHPQYQPAWRAKNPEKIREYTARYRAKKRTRG